METANKDTPTISVSVDDVSMQAYDMGFVLRAEGVFDRPEINHSDFIIDLVYFAEHKWQERTVNFVYEENNLRVVIGLSPGKVTTDGMTTFIQPHVSSVDLFAYNPFISESCDYNRLAKILRKSAKIDEYVSGSVQS